MPGINFAQPLKPQDIALYNKSLQFDFIINGLYIYDAVYA